MREIITSSIILLAKTSIEDQYIFGAYKDSGEATDFLQLPEDHEMFVNTLIGQQTVMGVNTLNATPLDFPDGGRICITHHPEKVRNDAIAATSIKQGIEIAKKRAEATNQEKIYVIGGAELIQQCLELQLLDEIQLTLTYGYKKQVENPIYLNFKLNNWKIIEDSGIMISANSIPKGLKFSYLRLKNK